MHGLHAGRVGDDDLVRGHRTNREHDLQLSRALVRCCASSEFVFECRDGRDAHTMGRHPVRRALWTLRVCRGSQVHLVWTAATDNMGVAVYLIERCQGSGCSNFTLVGTSRNPASGALGSLFLRPTASVCGHRIVRRTSAPIRYEERDNNRWWRRLVIDVLRRHWLVALALLFALSAQAVHAADPPAECRPNAGGSHKLHGARCRRRTTT